MSRTLARLRAATGDALLVRAGRGLVPTPRAAELRERVRDLAQEARAVLRPGGAELPVSALKRAFTIRANESFVEAFAGRIVAAATAAAPGVRLRFAPKPDKNAQPLREGMVDLDIGVLGETAPELRVQALFRDRFVGVVRKGHPLLAAGEITPERYVAFGHVVASRRGRLDGPVDQALAALGLARDIVAIVPSFSAALAVTCETDLVALVTNSFLTVANGHQAETAGAGVQSFPLPVGTEPITVSLLWHPRVDADPAQRWLRGLVQAVCRDRGG